MSRIKGRLAHKAMCTLFGAEIAKSITPRDGKRAAFNARFFANSYI